MTRPYRSHLALCYLAAPLAACALVDASRAAFDAAAGASDAMPTPDVTSVVDASPTTDSAASIPDARPDGSPDAWTPGMVLVDPTSGLTTDEVGAARPEIEVTLDSAPTANVAIDVSSADPGEVTVTPPTLVFTPSDWFVPHAITLAGVDDDVDDGDQSVAIRLAPAVSADARYDGVDPPDAVVINVDDDTAGIVVMPTSGLVTTEAGGPDTFTLRLASQPTVAVTVALSTSDASEGMVSPASVMFEVDGWAVARTITVTGVDDAVDDGNQTYTIVVGPATSGDPIYDGATGTGVSVTNIDDD